VLGCEQAVLANLVSRLGLVTGRPRDLPRSAESDRSWQE
jgi:hypothetical protein